MALGEHKTGLGELHGSFSLVWGSLSLVWADSFLTCFSLSENSSKTHFCPKINESKFCCEFVLSFLFWTDFTDNSNKLNHLHQRLPLLCPHIIITNEIQKTQIKKRYYLAQSRSPKNRTWYDVCVPRGPGAAVGPIVILTSVQWMCICTAFKIPPPTPPEHDLPHPQSHKRAQFSPISEVDFCHGLLRSILEGLATRASRSVHCHASNMPGTSPGLSGHAYISPLQPQSTHHSISLPTTSSSHLQLSSLPQFSTSSTSAMAPTTTAPQLRLLLLALCAMAVSFSAVHAADPDPLQAFCVADLSATAPLVNGYACRPRSEATAQDFVYTGFRQPGPNLTHSFPSVILL